MERKRLNIDVTPDQEAVIEALRRDLGSSTTREAVLAAVQFASVLLVECREGARVMLKERDSQRELVIPGITRAPGSWVYLTQRDHPWRRQFCIKGRRLTAAAVADHARANDLSPEQTAEEFDLPLGAVLECLAYAEAHRDLIHAEAEEDRLRAARAQ